MLNIRDDYMIIISYAPRKNSQEMAARVRLNLHAAILFSFLYYFFGTTASQLFFIDHDAETY